MVYIGHRLGQILGEFNNVCPSTLKGLLDVFLKTEGDG
jgi:phosphatidate phosphatase PAH1